MEKINRMLRLSKKLDIQNKTVLYSVIFSIIILLAGCGVDIAKAAWTEPGASAPGGNIYGPLNTGADKQAKRGKLLLDPGYNTVDPVYQLEVRGAKNVFINYLDISNSLAVDTDTLYVKPGTNPGEGLVGMGTINPTTMLDVVGGTVTAGSSATRISGIAINASTSGADKSGIYGESRATTDTASVLGESNSGTGVYGLNTSTGAGIYAENGTADTMSAVRGSSSVPYNPATIIAAIEGRTGPTGWAGYFEQRLYGSERVIGRKFTPNRLQNSQIPYTAGWEIRTVGDSFETAPEQIAFDGQYLWISQLGWDNTAMYLINPTTGVIAEELQPTINNAPVRDITKLLYINGNIWASGHSAPGGDCGEATVESLIRISTGASHTVTNFPVGNCLGGVHNGVSGYVVDMVYDASTPGGPYIWTVNQLSQGSYPNYTYSHSVSRLNLSDNSFAQYTIAAAPQCLTLDPSRCNDGIDNNGANGTDRGCSYADGILRWGIDTAAKCSEIPGATWNPPGDSQCTNMAGSAPNLASDERLTMKAVGHPTGITLDTVNGNVWVSFDGMNSYNGEQQSIAGEGLVKIDANNPNNSSVICLKNGSGTDLPGRKLSDITYDSANRRIWMTYSSSFATFWPGSQGIGSLNPTSGTIDFEYTNQTTEHWPEAPIQIQFDDLSTGGLYLWMNSWNYGQHLYKYTISNSAIVDYTVPSYMHDFTFDRVTSGGPYVWGAHVGSSLLTKNQINSPYQVVSYIPKGAESGDLIFDGTYIWTSNSAGYSVSKYRASDGVKIGDYPTGRDPHQMIFDGTSIWTMNNYDPTTKNITRIRTSDGARLGDYNVNMPGGGGGADTVYDGRYMWVSGGESQALRKIDLQSCVDADGGSPNTGSCTAYQSFGTSGAVGHKIPASLYPNKVIFDGQDLWVTSNDNRVYKVSYTNTGNIANDTITVTGYTIQEISVAGNNITAINFDGTYVWLGTRDVNSTGSSVYKFNPKDCTGGICPLAGQIPIYHEPGKCSAGTNIDRYCTKDADCSGGGICQGMASNVTGMAFDGTNMWVYNGTGGQSVAARECNDGIDNNGGGKCDFNGCTIGGVPLPADPYCADETDLHEGNTGTECNDNIDNNGDGLCDYDGAAGSPGCSGKPDPGCSGPMDISEASWPNDSHLTRLVAATNQIVESTYVSNYSGTSGMQFDGTNIWAGINGSPYVLHQFYSGSGRGLTDMAGLVNLQGSLPGINQPGSFSISGSATIGTGLTVVGDLVVTNNVWGGADVNKNYGTSCDNGQYAKGLGVNGIVCRQL